MLLRLFVNWLMKKMFLACRMSKNKAGCSEEVFSLRQIGCCRYLVDRADFLYRVSTYSLLFGPNAFAKRQNMLSAK